MAQEHIHEEVIRTSAASMRTELVEVVVPIGDDMKGQGMDMHLSDYQPNPEKPGFLRAIARIHHHDSGFTSDDTVVDMPDGFVLRTTEPVLADPHDEEAHGIKSHTLWKMIGGLSVVTVAGIEVTRLVRRARKH